MIYHVVTVYPELIEAYASTGIIGRACGEGILSIDAVNIHDYSHTRYGNVDDSPYGGGAGMVMKVEPIYECIQDLKEGKDTKVVFFSPKGKKFTTEVAKSYKDEEELILLCGHFEGVDQRAIELCVDDQISIGDFIVTGGHIAAMTFMDTVSRYIEGVLGNFDSVTEESFENGLLEHEQYTRPYEFMGLKVPDILLSGNHAKIKEYNELNSIDETKKYRPDLIDKINEK